MVVLLATTRIFSQMCFETRLLCTGLDSILAMLYGLGLSCLVLRMRFKEQNEVKRTSNLHGLLATRKRRSSADHGHLSAVIGPHARQLPWRERGNFHRRWSISGSIWLFRVLLDQVGLPMRVAGLLTWKISSKSSTPYILLLI